MEKLGYVKLYRKLLNNPIFTSEKGLKIWIWCLLKANHKKKEIFIGRKKEEINEGQFLFGRKKASEELKMSGSTIWWWIHFINLDGYIDIKKTTKYSIITIKNWIKYQSIGRYIDNKSNHHQTIKDTNNNVNNVKNEHKNNIYISYKEKINKNHRLTDKAKNKIQLRLKEFTEEELLRAIDNFSRDNWWMDNNAQRGVAWFFHSEDRIDQFLNIKSKTHFKKYA